MEMWPLCTREYGSSQLLELNIGPLEPGGMNIRNAIHFDAYACLRGAVMMVERRSIQANTAPTCLVTGYARNHRVEKIV